MTSIDLDFSTLKKSEINKRLKDWAQDAWYDGRRGAAPIGSCAMVTRRRLNPLELNVFNAAMKAAYDKFTAPLAKAKQSVLKDLMYSEAAVLDLPHEFTSKYGTFFLYGIIRAENTKNGRSHYYVADFDKTYPVINGACDYFTHLRNRSLSFDMERNTYCVDVYYYPITTEVDTSHKNWARARAMNEFVKTVKATYDKILSFGYNQPKLVSDVDKCTNIHSNVRLLFEFTAA